MADMKTISAALKLIDSKKESLRKAFEDLQANSSALSSFTLTWSAIDAHFSSVQSSLTHQFNILHSRNETVDKNGVLRNNDALAQPPPNEAVPSHPQLKIICSAMDAEALSRYVMIHPRDRGTLRLELPDAFRVAPDPARMVLDTLLGFFPQNGSGYDGSELHELRRSCVFLLEQLMLFSPEIGEDVRQGAKSLAAEWKEKVKAGDNTLNPLGFLHLLAAYGLAPDYDSTELIELLASVARFREVFGLCRGLNLVDKVPDLITRLISNGKQSMAIKFVLEFKLTEKVPLIPLLKDIVESSRDVARKTRKAGKHSLQSLNEATSKEISGLKVAIKYIKDCNLESEYPSGPLEERVERLENQMAERTAAKKRPAAAPAPNSKQKKKNRNRRVLSTASVSPAAPRGAAGGSSSNAAAAFQQSGLAADGPVPYMNTSPSTGVYGFPGVPIGFPGNRGPPMSHGHPMEPPMPFAHPGYGLQPPFPHPYFPH